MYQYIILSLKSVNMHPKGIFSIKYFFSGIFIFICVVLNGILVILSLYSSRSLKLIL